MPPKKKYPKTISTHPQYDHPHLTISNVPPQQVQKQLAAFLAKTPTTPHLHPDAFLSRTGVTYSNDSGPDGGIALHHLKRMDRALKGEHLDLETLSELAAQFGVEAVEKFTSISLRTSDDTRLDAQIEGERDRKRRKTAEWAEDVSSHAEYATPQEIESFANTPLHVPNDMEEEYQRISGLRDNDDDDGRQDKEEYDQQQEVWTGEIDDGRQGAPMVQQNGVVPPVISRDKDGNVVVPPKGTTDEEKLARKEAKRLKKLDKQQKKDRGESQQKPATHLDPPNHTGETQEGNEVAKVKKMESEKEARKEGKRVMQQENYVDQKPNARVKIEEDAAPAKATKTAEDREARKEAKRLKKEEKRRQKAEEAQKGQG